MYSCCGRALHGWPTDGRTCAGQPGEAPGSCAQLRGRAAQGGRAGADAGRGVPRAAGTAGLQRVCQQAGLRRPAVEHLLVSGVRWQSEAFAEVRVSARAGRCRHSVGWAVGRLLVKLGSTTRAGAPAPMRCRPRQCGPICLWRMGAVPMHCSIAQLWPHEQQWRPRQADPHSALDQDGALTPDCRVLGSWTSPGRCMCEATAGQQLRIFMRVQPLSPRAAMLALSSSAQASKKYDFQHVSLARLWTASAEALPGACRASTAR